MMTRRTKTRVTITKMTITRMTGITRLRMTRPTSHLTRRLGGHHLDRLVGGQQSVAHLRFQFVQEEEDLAYCEYIIYVIYIGDVLYTCRKLMTWNISFIWWKNPHPISAVAIGLLVSSLVARVHRAAHHTTRVQLDASLDWFKCYCVTRAPLLYFVRSWVALSFKVCQSVSESVRHR